MNNKNGNMDSVKRKYDSLKGWVGRNPVEKLGTVICVSTKNDDDYDLSFIADGKSTFLQLYDKAISGAAPETPIATKEDVEDAVAKFFEQEGYLPTDEEQKQSEDDIETDWEKIMRDAEKGGK